MSGIDQTVIQKLISGNHENAFDVLGPHRIEDQGEPTIRIRAFLPDSQQAWILHPSHSGTHRMKRVHPAGLFETELPDSELYQRSPYKIRTMNNNGVLQTFNDPYSFEPLLTDVDLYLFSEGNHRKIYDKLGAHLRTIGDIKGVNFAVWAPNAQNVALVGDFNEWNDCAHPMRQHSNNGVWELFVPELGAGEKYKFRIRTKEGHSIDKSDPYGFAAELPPQTASVVTDLSSFEWSDNKWISERANANPLEKPVSVYELHLGSWKRDVAKHNGWKNYRDLAHELVDYCHHQGYTHVELMPVCEHPFTGSWGYQTVGYYATTSRYGTPQDFMYFVNHCHQNGIGVILDWVPAHFPKDEFGLGRFDGSALYEHADPRQGEHPDWGTYIFNYGRNEVRNFLVSNALFWLEKFHIDGLRVDAVASMLYLDYSREGSEWVPNCFGGRENLEAIDFLKEFNEQVHAAHPGVMTIAEESTAWGGVSRPTYSGGLGFSFKWNMGWMNDTLRFMRKDPVHRGHHHGELTFSLIYAFTENFMLPFSHDEVVHGKGSLLDQMPGDLWQKYANLRLLYSYMWTHPGKKLLFQGCDIAQWKEFDHDTEPEWDLLQWDSHLGMQKLVADLNALYKREPALHQVDFEGHGFEWIDCHNSDLSVLAYLRKAKDPSDYLLVVCNFTPVPRTKYRVGVPHAGAFKEVFNSDSSFYAGSNLGNEGERHAADHNAQGRIHSIEVDIPPLGVCVFKPLS